MTRPLRAAVVGCGPRAATHLEAMRASGCFDPIALCDIDPVRLAKTGSRHRIEPRYRNAAELVERETPDLVAIVTGPIPRVAVLDEVVAAGARAVLIEKPIGLLPSEIESARRLGEQALIAVNTQYRWMPHWRRAWQLLAEGAFGDLRSIRCSTRTNALEQGPHVLDLALEAARVGGAGAPEWILAGTSGAEVYDGIEIPAELDAIVGLGDARLHWSQGECAPLVPGETAFFFQIQVEIVGARGRLWVSLDQGFELELDGKLERGTTSWPRDDEVAQEALYRDLADAIETGDGATFPTRMEVAGDVADLIFAGFASGATSTQVTLPT
jgi:predicted dehydrogenase